MLCWSMSHPPISQIQGVCEDYLLHRITLSNCVSVSLYAQKHTCHRLLEGADSYSRLVSEYIEIPLPAVTPFMGKIKYTYAICIYNKIYELRKSLLYPYAERVFRAVMKPSNTNTTQKSKVDVVK